MALRDRFFKLKLKITDIKLKAKAALPAAWNKIKSTDAEQVKDFLRGLFLGIRPLIFQTPLNLKEWTFKTFTGFLRYLLLFGSLSLIFYIASARYAFTANDAFISFRYVSNAVKGWGYTFNPPPFEPISGYTSFLWLAVLRALWAVGFEPPQSANFLTFVFSMGQIVLCFLFLRRASIQQNMQAKSLYLFLLLCLVLLTNRTFLAFITSGTEAALFNFLVLWWAFAALSNKKDGFFSLSVAAVLLALCRTEGIIFIPASAFFLVLFMFQGRSKVKCILSLFLLGSIGLYYVWLNNVYGSFIPHSFSSAYRSLFPDFGRDYLLSFILEYALYFWVFFFLIWVIFKFMLQRQKGFTGLFLTMLTFAAYIGFYLFIMGGDSLEYRPLSFFIPLCTLAGITILAENIVGKVSSVSAIVVLYILISTAIPMTHRSMTKHLETRRETTFLYRPVSGKAGWFSFFTKQWDEAQKKLIYQGIGLRHQEHKVLTEELLRSFPDREEGSRIPKAANHLFAWDFIGVPGWTLPEVIIIDLSGQNNKIAAMADFKFPNRRLFGHERSVPDGYVQCFGGRSLYIDPFAGKKNLTFQKQLPLSDGKIKGCESFWRTQLGKGSQKTKSLRDGFLKRP
ncbi:MAG: hypothetical protein IJ752_00040 [Alphaproteobacteria bacterium]|nr:hypothetical protein [Alphaproteobacteria bacterium]